MTPCADFDADRGFPWLDSSIVVELALDGFRAARVAVD